MITRNLSDNHCHSFRRNSIKLKTKRQEWGLAMKLLLRRYCHPLESKITNAMSPSAQHQAPFCAADPSFFASPQPKLSHRAVFLSYTAVDGWAGSRCKPVNKWINYHVSQHSGVQPSKSPIAILWEYMLQPPSRRSPVNKSKMEGLHPPLSVIQDLYGTYTHFSGGGSSGPGRLEKNINQS